MLYPGKFGALVQAVVGEAHAPTFPDVLYLALLDSGNSEVTGTGYARVSVPNDATVWGDDGDTVTNVQPLDAGTPGAGDWPDVHAIGFFDEFDEVIIDGALTAPITPAAGVPIVFLAGSIVWSVSPNA